MIADEEVDGRPERRSDGEQTHAEILDAAMRLASIEGLGSLTFGRLADDLEVSKSGVFAHFRSKEQLQQETVAAADEVFRREVLEPGMDAPEGRARLESVCEAYLSYLERGVFPGGCFFAQLLAEYDARSGPIHERVAEDQHNWLGFLAEQIEIAQDRGEIDRAEDPQQLAFDLYAPLELANYLSVLLRDTSVVERGRAAVRTRLAAAAPDVSGGAARSGRGR